MALGLLTVCSTSWLQAQEVPNPRRLKVFILAGQSNMQGHAHVRTFGAMALSPETAPLLEQMVGPDGQPKVCERVWITCIGCGENEMTGRLTAGFGAQARGPKIGPEFTFGLEMEKRLPNPILIIKTAWGGKSLNTDFRPPGAGPYEFNQTQLEALRRQGKDIAAAKAAKAEATGRYYRLMMEHIRNVLADPARVCPAYDPAAGYEVAGFVWFQGWNDMVDRGTYPKRDQPGGYELYSRLLAQLIRDVRAELGVPELPFVIGVMGVGGPTAQCPPEEQRHRTVHQNFRDAMAAPASMPEFAGTVAAVLTERYWDQEVAALRRRERELKPRLDAINRAVKEGRKTPEQGRQEIEALYAETFTPRERELLQTSVSNAEYHYLGSARIMARIGQAFAQAMDELCRHRAGR